MPLGQDVGCVPATVGEAESRRILGEVNPHGNYQGIKVRAAAGYFRLLTGMDVSNATAYRAFGAAGHAERADAWCRQFGCLDSWHKYLKSCFPGSCCSVEYRTALDEHDNVQYDI